jgi:S-ribosylhomocysteine lyase
MEELRQIESFQVDHEKLKRGLYVSRIDRRNDEVVTTYDIRMTEPNKERVMDTMTIHTLEHLGATYLRSNEKWKNEVIYFGPMGCRTGFYLSLWGERSSKDLVDLMKDMYKFMADFEGNIPGQSPKECGNYTDLGLPRAKQESKKYLEEVLLNIKEDNLIYPQ